MHHYTYKITFEEVPHIYYGVRSSKCLPEEDFKYTGSPKTNKQYWSLYTPRKTILSTYKTRKEAELAENELIREQWDFNISLSLNATISNEKFNMLGKKQTDKQKEIVRKTHLGKRRSPETTEAIRKALTGKKKSPEHIENMRKAITGRKLSPEHIEKVRKSLIGRKGTEKQKEVLRQLRIKSFYIVSPTGQVFQGTNLLQFCEDNNLNHPHCHKVLKGDCLHNKGWTASLELHQVYLEYYNNRGIRYNGYRWLIRWHDDSKRQQKHFKTKDEAIAFRDQLESKGYEFKISCPGWKDRLKQMQRDSASSQSA